VTQNPPPKVVYEPTVLSLIGERYLDTQHDRESIAWNEARLSALGIVGLKRWALEYLAASSLWWNVLWWEWGTLDGRHISYGWTLNLIVFQLVGIALLFIFGPKAALVGPLLLHGLTTWIGFSIRSGSVLEN
jgi:hypothetical protein